MEKTFRTIYLVAAWAFVAGVVLQVFLAGMVVVALQMGWGDHIGLGHFLAAPLLLMLISQYPAHTPKPMKRLTWLLFGVYLLQADVVIFLRSQVPVISALHPVLALFDFALGFVLARRAAALVRQVATPAGVRSVSDNLPG